MTVKPTKTIEIFCSYAPYDKARVDKLELQLQLLKRRGQIAEWHGSKIPSEKELPGEIDPHLNTAHIILLLISAHYLASEYLYEVEMMTALKRHQAGEARVIPIMLRAIEGWKETPLGKLYVLPKYGKPITDWLNPNDAFSDVTKAIQIVIKELSAQLPISP